MIHGPTCFRLVVAALLMAALSGCRPLNGPKGFSLPWSKAAWSRQTFAPPPSPASEPLRPEQKIEIQLAFAQRLESQGRADEAKKIYLEVVKTAPQRADAHHLLGRLHARNGECQTAEAYYQQAIRLAPELAEPYCDLGYSYYLQQRWPEAEEQLRRAITLDPDLRRAHNNWGLLLARTGREPEAFDAFARAGCSEAEAHANVAFALSLAERWDAAGAHFQRALALDPNLKPAQQGLAGLESLASKHFADISRPGRVPFHAGSAPASFNR